MWQKQTGLYRFCICLIGILSVIASVALIDVFDHEEFFNSSLINLMLIHVVVFYVSNLSETFDKGDFTNELKAMTTYTIQYFLFTTLALFLDKEMSIDSRKKMVYVVVLHAVFLYIIQKISKTIRKRIYNNAKHLSKVMLVTTTDRLEAIASRMAKKENWGGQISSVLILDEVDRSHVVLPKYFEGSSRVDMSIFESFITRQVVDEAFIHLDAEYDMVVSALVPVFEEAGIDVNVNITAFDIDTNAERKIEKLSNFSVIKFSTKFYNPYSILMKRCIDILFAIVGLALTLPVAIILVPLIKLDSKGPAIFAQDRVGKNGRIFKFYKFRSMSVDAEERKKDLMDQNEVEGLMFKMENDPRVTRVGKFIRKTSLDELPQFYNILIGDMSLVGTRPPTVEEYEKYTRKQKKRLSLKPGITGLWQVSGRSDIKDFDEVVKLDTAYIDNWSLWLDIKIILKTFKIVLLGSGAK